MKGTPKADLFLKWKVSSAFFALRSFLIFLSSSIYQPWELVMGIGDPLPVPHSFDSCCCLACALQGGNYSPLHHPGWVECRVGGGSVSTPHSCLRQTICHEDMDTFNLLKVTASHPYPDQGRWKSLFLVKQNSHNLAVYSQACVCFQHMCAKRMAAFGSLFFRMPKSTHLFFAKFSNVNIPV